MNNLIVSDDVCQKFKQLADYEFGNYTIETSKKAKLIDVEILGHIFEQSISDLEELRRKVQDTGRETALSTAPTKRKKEGAFYTPAFVTRYIVAETLGPILIQRFEHLRQRLTTETPAKLRKLLNDPRSFEKTKLTKLQVDTLVHFWTSWLEELETIRVVDPSCGSGAFLIEAFDQLYRQYEQAQAYLTELQGLTLFDVQRTILTKNLFGMDLNGEAVEIARLSCWIKTAEAGKELTALDDNIQVGNSVIAEPNPLTAWKKRFPEVFQAGGFDAVIGNPPYVRQEWITADKPFLKEHYQAFDGVADLYVYFYELGLKILKPGGRLGFIVTNKWLKAGYGEALRSYYSSSAWIESVVDLGHNKQIFPDADVFPCILVVRKPIASEPEPENTRTCILPREQFRIDDLSRQALELGSIIPRSRFSSQPWNLEPPGVATLMAKIKAKGIPLKEYIGTVPYRGFMTGFNEAYLIDSATKDRLVNADPKSESLFRPCLRGQDIDRWQAEWAGLWMITMKSSTNHPWPWAGKPEAEAEVIFQKTYPTLFQHMKQYEAQLRNRKNSVEYWWELSGSTYWNEFEKPKVMYGEITWFSAWCIDNSKMYSNNTVYFIPKPDLWVVAVGNSNVIWWYSWRAAIHGKDEALRFIRAYVEQLPIPKPTQEILIEVEDLSGKLIELTSERQAGIRAILDWLKSEFSIEKPTQKLSALIDLKSDQFLKEIRKIRGKQQSLTVQDVKRLNDTFISEVVPLQANARQALIHERRISELVNQAYGLTPEEVELMWQTAPPRMPITPE